MMTALDYQAGHFAALDGGNRACAVRASSIPRVIIRQLEVGASRVDLVLENHQDDVSVQLVRREGEVGRLASSRAAAGAFADPHEIASHCIDIRDYKQGTIRGPPRSVWVRPRRPTRDASPYSHDH